MEITQVTMANFPDLLDSAMQVMFKDEIDKYDYLSKIYTFDKPYHDRDYKVSNRTKLGVAPLLPDGATDFTSDVPYQGYDQTITQAIYGLQVAAGLHLKLFGRFNETASFATDIAESIVRTIQILGHAPFNNAFDASVTLGDGVCLCSSAHPRAPGLAGTQSNISSTPNILSYTTMQNDLIAWVKLTEDRGGTLLVVPDIVFLPVDSMFAALAIEKTLQDPGSALNSINVIRSGFPGITYMKSPYLTDTRRHFYLAKDRIKLIRIWRAKPNYRTLIDDASEATVFRGYTAFGVGVADYKWIFGNAGA